LSDRDQVIYPGKLSDAPCFRIGHIGHLSETDVHTLVTIVAEVLAEMQIDLRKSHAATAPVY
jgi:2-aminoethylphosphonate-pyruvate transaminase